jgi:SAM-dependent methyltransferase
VKLPRLVRQPLVSAFNRWLAFRASRVVSVRDVAAANTRDAFDRLYGSPDLMREYLGPERLAFYDEVATRCIGDGGFRRVVDVGCGSGHLLAALLNRMSPPPLMVGVDEAPQAIERLAEVVPNARGIVASVYDLDERLDQASYDLVLCTEVLEHLERPREALDQLRRLRAPEGRLVVTVPDGEIDDYEGHVSFWSIDEFRGLLRHAGSTRVERLADGTLYGVVEG